MIDQSIESVKMTGRVSEQPLRKDQSSQALGWGGRPISFSFIEKTLKSNYATCAHPRLAVVTSLESGCGVLTVIPLDDLGPLVPEERS